MSEAEPNTATVLRRRDAAGRVTNAELLFDLVYVFAVTQLSQHLLQKRTAESALQTALLLGFVWLAWAYTAWVTNWLDPDRIPVRMMLFVVGIGSLVMSAGLPGAFATRGWWVAGAYAAMRVGRTTFIVVVLHLEGPTAPALGT